jgi:uncharacterized zinc-type alcohol dehydrogenase-like protein
VLADVGERYGLTVLEPPIPRTVRFAEAPAVGRSILATARKSSKGAAAYRDGREGRLLAAPVITVAPVVGLGRYAAHHPRPRPSPLPVRRFEAVALERRDLRDDDVLIDIAFAGICHSDIHTVRDEWGSCALPADPRPRDRRHALPRSARGDRHKPSATASGSAAGRLVRRVRAVQGRLRAVLREAVGRHVQLARGMTASGRQGGYSQQIVVTERMVVCGSPRALDLDVAAPLLCAGITTYSPLKRWGAGPGRKVAVIGVGGLGHMAVKIAAAMGAEVTTLSRRSDAKAADAIELGASRAPRDLRRGRDEGGARGSFDLIINTVSADLDMDAVPAAAASPTGRWSNVGPPNEPYSVPPFALIGGNKVLTGSAISAVSPRPRRCSTSAPSTASARRSNCSTRATRPPSTRPGTVVVAGDVRYRVVIDTATIPQV